MNPETGLSASLEPTPPYEAVGDEPNVVLVGMANGLAELGIGEDYKRALRELRGPLRNVDGLEYRAFKLTLEPRFGQVWRDLLPAQLALAVTLASLAWLQALVGGLGGQLALVAVGAVLLGTLITYVGLFLHEAAHFGLHRNRAINDRLGYACIGILLGADMAAYRVAHFVHHRRLGETDDTEPSYFEAPDVGLLLRSLSGIRTLQLALGRKYLLGIKTKPVGMEASLRHMFSPLLGGLALHATIVGGFLACGKWVPAAAWVLGMGVVFPLLGTLRQILEHRDEAAEATIDYTRVPHGATSRLFGAGLLASYFGGAGFNRHLLHHLEPSISYTRLGDLEDFLRATTLRPYLERRTTTYARTFLALVFPRRKAPPQSN
jgi:fatty acid desaturase